MNQLRARALKMRVSRGLATSTAQRRRQFQPLTIRKIPRRGEVEIAIEAIKTTTRDKQT